MSSKIISWIKSRTRKKEPKRTPYGEIIEEEEDTYVGDLINGVRTKLEEMAAYAKLPKSKVQLRWLKPVKRSVATILLFLYAATSFLSYPEPVFILPLLTSLIMLDYLWKTRL